MAGLSVFDRRENFFLRFVGCFPTILAAGKAHFYCNVLVRINIESKRLYNHFKIECTLLLRSKLHTVHYYTTSNYYMITLYTRYSTVHYIKVT